MFGKNNQKMAQFRHADQRQRFAVRKLGIGVVSVLIGAVLAGGTFVAQASADSTTGTTQPEALTSSGSTTSVTANTATMAAANHTVSSSSQATIAATTTTNATAVTTTAPTTTGPTATTTTADNNLNTPDTYTKTLGPTATDEEIKALTSSTPTTVKDPNSDDHLTISHNTVGNDGTDTGVTLSLFFNGQPGDIYTLTIPNSAAYSAPGRDKLSGAATLSGAQGTTTVKAVNGGLQYIYTINQAASYALPITISRNNGYLAQRTPMTDTDPVGTYARLIQWSRTRNGVTEQMPSLPLWQIIRPTWKPSDVTLTGYEGANVTRIPVNKTQTFFVAVNETNGVSNDGRVSALVNSALNSGTVITIPVPAHFTLDEAATMRRNAFSDRTTISQPGGSGHDVIITAPKGAGKQNWTTDWVKGKGYYLVGGFVMDMPADTTTLTAADNPLASNHGVGTIKQTVMTPTGASEISVPLTPFSANIIGASPKPQEGKMALYAYGNNGPATFLLDDDSTNDPAIVNFFGFGNLSVYDFDHNYNIQLDLADGLFVNGFKTPVLAGTTSYTYKYTRVDSSTVSGTVKAGEAVTDDSGKTIRKIELTPDLLKAATTTDSLLQYHLGGDYGPTKQNNKADAIIVYGHLAKTLDNGTPVTKQTILKSTISVSSPIFNASTIYSNWVNQTVYTEADLKAKVGAELSPAVRDTADAERPGTMAAGKINLRYASLDKATNQIYEPIFYYVLPASAEYNAALGLANPQNGVQPQVTTTQVTKNGQTQTVVKIDYTGTGYYFKTDKDGYGSDTDTVFFNNKNDAQPGNYAWAVYAVSPRTPLTNTQVVDSTVVGDDKLAGPLYLLGDGKWTINVPASFYVPDMSKGNLNSAYENHGRSDDKGTIAMSYQIKVANNTFLPLINPRLLTNLPQAGDKSFEFQLTGPAEFVPAGNIDAKDVKFYYSTQTQDINAPASPLLMLFATAATDTTDKQISLTGYKTADQVQDWSKIRSIVVDLPNIPMREMIGSFLLHGVDPTVTYDAGKVGPINTVMTADGRVPYEGSMTNITVRGTATVTARYHYQDAEGKDQHVDLLMLTKTYNDNKDTMKKSDFALTDEAKKLIPAGYELAPASDTNPGIINGGKTWVTDAPNEKAAFDQVAKYYFDSDIVQYELVHKITETPKTITKTVNYYYDTVGGTKVQAPFTTTVTITEKTDQVTGEKTYWLGSTQLPGQGTTTLVGQTLPNQPGYTAVVQDDKTADATGATTVDYNSGNVMINVVYTANPQHAKFIYHDDTTEENILTVPKDGVSNATIDYTTPAQIAAFAEQGYEKVSDNTNGQALTFDHDDDKDQVFTIHLKHKMEATTRTKELTRTITYVDQNHQPVKGDDGQVLLPVVQKVTVTENGTTDLQTGTTTWHGDWTSGDHPAVLSPTVTGYTPNTAEVAKETVTSSDELFDQDQNTEVTVVYAPTQETVTTYYRTADGKDLKPSETQTGSYGNNYTTSAKEIEGYHLTTTPANANGIYTTNTPDVTYVYAPDEESVTVHYQTVDGTPLAKDDQIPGLFGDRYQTSAKEIKGYHLKVTPANANGIYTTNTPDVTYVYAPDTQTATLTFIDNTTPTHQPLAKLAVTGDYQAPIVFSDQGQSYQSLFDKYTKGDQAPYVLDPSVTSYKGQAVTYKLEGNDYFVYLVHHLVDDQRTKQITQTIHYVDQNGQPMLDEQGQTLPDSVQTITVQQHGTKDLATGVTQWDGAWTSADYQAVDSPVVAGYTVDQAQVPKQTVTSTNDLVTKNQDTLITVTYTPVQRPARLEFIDLVTGETLTTVSVSGAYNSPINFTDGQGRGYKALLKYYTTGDQHYQLVVGDPAHVSYDGRAVKYTLGDDTYKVYLTHQTATVQDTKKIQQTIHYVDQAGQPMHDHTGTALADNHQTVTLSRSGTHDLVTGETTWQEWSTDHYQAVDSPKVAGYTADQPTVAGETVNGDNTDKTVTVTYTPNQQTALVTYYDDNTGQPLGAVDQLSGKSDQTLTYTTAQRLKEYVDQGYELVRDETGGQPITLDHDDKVTQSYVVHLKHRTETVSRTKQITQTIQYVDRTGQPMKDAAGQTLADNVQTVTLTQRGMTDLVTQTTTWDGLWTTADYTTVDSPVLTGYTPSQDQVTGTAVTTSNELVAKNQDTLVVITYTPNAATVKVHYQTTDGQPVADSQNLVGKYGESYETTAKSISGYHLIETPANASGKYTTNTPDVIYVYAPDEESVTVHYQTADGTPLADDEHATGVYGGEYTTSTKEISGYHLTETPSNATGKYTTNTPNVTYVYAPDEESVTVHYQTADGKDLVPSETQTGSYGSGYTTSAKEIAGYHLTETPSNATGKYTTDTPDVTYVYAPDEESVTVHYQTADGTVLADDEHATGVYGGEYTTSAKKISGYHLTATPGNATGKYTTDTPDVTYVYAPDEESVTVHYQTADGTPLAPSETLHGEYGGTYTTKAKEIAGYQLVATPTNASGTYTEDTPAVIYVYVPAHKGETNEPTQPTAPVTPTSPTTPATDQPAATTSTPAPADPHPISGAQPMVSTPVARVSHPATAPASRLPQTGNDSAAAWQVALGGLIGSLSLLALVKRKRAQ